MDVELVTKSPNHEEACSVNQNIEMRKIPNVFKPFRVARARTGSLALVSLSSHFVRLLTPSQNCPLDP